MFYFLHGSDTHKARQKMHALVASLVAKKPDASLVSVDVENWNENMLPELVFGQGLFEQKKIVVLDTILGDNDIRESILNILKDIADSSNIFIFLNGVLPASVTKKLENYAAKTQVFDTRSAVQKDFNLFSLADALGRRDRKRLWTLYHKAKFAGVPDEKIHGILFWQAKALALAADMKSAEEADLNPFVFRKSHDYARHWPSDTRAVFMGELIAVYHDAHRGMRDFSIGLERLLLRV